MIYRRKKSDIRDTLGVADFSVKNLHCSACEKTYMSAAEHNAASSRPVGLTLVSMPAFPEYIYYSDNSSDSDTRLATVRFTGTSHGPGRCALPLSKKARNSSSDQHDISGSSSRSSAKHLVGGGG